MFRSNLIKAQEHQETDMLPDDYEPEDLDLLNVLKAHTNSAYT